MFKTTLNVGETVTIRGDIRVVFLGWTSGQKTQVRIGIDAPKEVPIHRDDAKRKTPLGKYV